MKKKSQILLILIFAIFVGFSSNYKKVSDIDYITNERIFINEPLKLLNNFPVLKVENIIIESINSEFRDEYATALDSANATLISKIYGWDYHPFLRFYPLYQIKISENVIGLIYRRPGMYGPYKTDILAYNKKDSTLGKYLELADDWGDAGSYTNTKSWIIDVNKDKYPDIIRWKHSFSAMDLPSGEPLGGILSDSIFVHYGNDEFFNLEYIEATRDSAVLIGNSYEILTILKRMSKDTIFGSDHHKMDLIDFEKYKLQY